MDKNEETKTEAGKSTPTDIGNPVERESAGSEERAHEAAVTASTRATADALKQLLTDASDSSLETKPSVEPKPEGTPSNEELRRRDKVDDFDDELDSLLFNVYIFFSLKWL